MSAAGMIRLRAALGEARSAEPRSLTNDTGLGGGTPSPGLTGVARLREAEGSAPAADTAEAGRAALTGIVRLQTAAANASAPGRLRPGWDSADAVRVEQEARETENPFRRAASRVKEYAEAAKAPGARDASPDYPGELGRYGAGESSHRSGRFGGSELPEAYRWIPEEADYGEYSRYIPTGTGKGTVVTLPNGYRQWLDTGYDDTVYEYVNGNTDAISKQYTNESVTGGTLLGTDSRFLDNLSSTERGVYNYLHAKQGHEAADRFLSDLQSELNARQREKEEAYWTEEAERNPVGMSVFSTLTKPLSVFSYAQQAEKVLSGEKLDLNAGYNRGSYTAKAIRGAVSQEIENSGKWGKAGSYGYNLALSMGDFLYTSAITGGMEPLALTVMGTEAAADSVLAAKERGLSDKRSFIIGTAAGVIEAATEKIGFDALFKTGIRSLGRTGFRRYILRNAGAEAAEEGASDLLNWIADDLYDLVTGTEESEFKQLVAVYEENGLDHTKALLSALGDRGKELGLDTLGGFLSGLFLSGAKSGYNAIQFNRMGQEAFDTGSYRDYISLGLLADHDSEAYRYAQEIRAKLNAGRAVTNIEMGQLTAAVYADALGVGEKRNAEVREEPEEEIWDRVFDEEKDDDFQRELAEEFGLDEPAGQEALTDEAPGNTIGAEFAILRSLGAKAKNYMVLDPASNKEYPFVEGTRIKDPIVFAGKGTSKELHEEVAQGLSEKIGGKPSEWQHCKGIGILNVDGKDMEAEVHWFQEPSVGKHRFKVKKWMDD